MDEIHGKYCSVSLNSKPSVKSGQNLMKLIWTGRKTKGLWLKKLSNISILLFSYCLKPIWVEKLSQYRYYLSYFTYKILHCRLIIFFYLKQYWLNIGSAPTAIATYSNISVWWFWCLSWSIYAEYSKTPQLFPFLIDFMGDIAIRNRITLFLGHSVCKKKSPIMS